MDRQDVNLSDGALHVRAAKHRKQREVALHPTTTEAMRDYARLRDRHRPQPETRAFFVSHRGRGLSYVAFSQNFTRLIRAVGLEGQGPRARPRPHDLRHTFAVRTLLNWYRDGAEVERELPLLSTYLGHVQATSTYWYLQAAPELLQLIGQRLDCLSGGES